MRGIFNKNAMPGGRVRLKHPVWFVRHGQTDWNAERRFQGHADIPLNDTGRAQAAANGEALAADITNPGAIQFIVSPLSRTRETLEIIRERLSLPRQRYRLDDRLIEIDLGDWNGKTPDEVNAENPGIFEQRERNKWSYRIPGGESYEEAAARTREFLTTLQGPSLIVGHGASGRILRGYLRGLKADTVAHLQAPQNAAIKLYRGREELLRGSNETVVAAKVDARARFAGIELLD